MENRVTALIERIKAKPAIYLGRHSILALGHFLRGYCLALYELDKSQSEADRLRNQSEDDLLVSFQEAIQKKYKIQASRGWDEILCFQAGSDTAGLERFWKEWDEHLARLARIEARNRRKARLHPQDCQNAVDTRPPSPVA